MADFNITDLLREVAGRWSQKTAILQVCDGKPAVRLTFAELDALCDRYAAGLRRMGLAPGERVLILAQPDEHFAPFVLGLLRAGGVVAMVDPGRPLGEMMDCIAQLGPTGLLASPLVQALSLGFPKAFGKVKWRISARGRFPGAVEMARLPDGPGEALVGLTQAESEAAVLFTTGSTGAPKGVAYSHAILHSQCQALQAGLQLAEDEVGLFGASAMMLLGLSSGVTAVLADALNVSPRQVDIATLAQLLEEQRITLSFASPVLSRKLAAYARQHPLRFAQLRKLVVGGAPVEAGLVRELQALLPNGDVIISLGATEVMPIAMLSGSEALRRSAEPGRQFAGVCTGFPAPGCELRVIEIQDGPLADISSARCLPAEQVGEVIVRGPAVTQGYLGRADLTALAKIQDGDSTWHRTGDLGFLDAAGCLWFCGRKSQRVQTRQGRLLTLPCEVVFNQHPAVARSALVGLGVPGEQTAVIVIESKPGQRPRGRAEQEQLARELRQLAESAGHTRSIRQFAFYPGVFPVDIRHNSKINREVLAEWIQRHPRALRQP